MSQKSRSDIASFLDTLQWGKVPTREEKARLSENGEIQSATFLCPADLHQRFKIAVMSEGEKSMTNVIIAFMETYVASHEARQRQQRDS